MRCDDLRTKCASRQEVAESVAEGGGRGEWPELAGSGIWSLMRASHSSASIASIATLGRWRGSDDGRVVASVSHIATCCSVALVTEGRSIRSCVVPTLRLGHCL